MKTSSNKQKARLGQQEIRDKILETFPELEPDDVRSTAMGQGGVDIQLSPKAKKIFPVSSEVKRRREFKTLYDFYGQADRKDGLNPVVFLRGDRKPWLVVINLEYFLDLARKNVS